MTAAMRQTQRERAIRRSAGGTEPGHWFESWEEYANAFNHHHHLLPNHTTTYVIEIKGAARRVSWLVEIDCVWRR